MVLQDSLFWAMLRNMRSKKLNKEMVGYSITGQLDPIALSDTLAYASATRDHNALYQGETALAPPCFAATLIFPFVKKILVHPKLKLNMLNMVHGEMDIHWHEVLKVGQTLDISLKIESIEETPAGELMNLKAALHTGSKVAAEATTGIMVRTRKAKPKKKQPSTEKPKIAFERSILTEDGQQLEYAAASGDNNFIHTNNMLAKLAGLPRTIMHGMAVLAMAQRELLDELAEGDIRQLKRLQCRFAAPAMPGQTLTLQAYATKSKKTIAFEVLNPKGKTVLKSASIELQ